jgi:hypothetical protein
MRITIVDFIEDFYGSSVEDVAQSCAHMDSADVGRNLRVDEFVELHASQFEGGVSLHQLDQLEPYATLPVYSRAGAYVLHHGRPGSPDTGVTTTARDGTKVSLINPYSVMSTLFAAPGLNDSKELKGILLYSDGAILVDPFAARRKLSNYEWEDFEHRFGERLNPMGYSSFYAENHSVATRSFADRPHDFTSTLELIAEIAPLIRTGSVAVASIPARDSIYWGDEAQLLYCLGEAYFVRSDGRPQRFRESELVAYILLERAKDQILAMATLGDAGTPFAAGDLDLVAIDLLLEEQVRLGALELNAPQRSSEDARLTAVARLQLPGVDAITARDMVRVRDEDLFARFRSDVRDALSFSDEEERIDVAAQMFSEEMRAAASRLESLGNRAILARATGGDAVSWAVGMLAGWSIDGWRGALAGLAAKGVYEVRRGSSPGVRALHRHYLALS